MIKIAKKGMIKEINLPLDSSISAILEYSNIDLLEKESISSDGKQIKLSDFDKKSTHNGCIFISAGSSSSAPTPKIKKAIKFLKKYGYEKVLGGKGDHMKFKNSNSVIILNPDNNDKKHLDLGSAKSLARKFSINLAELYKEISSF